MTSTDQDLQRATTALLELAADRPWSEISLRDIAARAEVTLADLYARAHSRDALLALISTAFDQAALATAATPSEDFHDRLFDAAMARVEAMEPHRAALVAITRGAGRSWSLVGLAARLPRTARAILEAAGLEATPPRLAAMTAVWARAAQVWRDDEGALNRTMAELDKRLKQMRKQLTRVGAGF